MFFRVVYFDTKHTPLASRSLLSPRWMGPFAQRRTPAPAPPTARPPRRRLGCRPATACGWHGRRARARGAGDAMAFKTSYGVTLASVRTGALDRDRPGRGGRHRDVGAARQPDQLPGRHRRLRALTTSRGPAGCRLPAERSHCSRAQAPLSRHRQSWFHGRGGAARRPGRSGCAGGQDCALLLDRQQLAARHRRPPACARAAPSCTW